MTYQTLSNNVRPKVLCALFIKSKELKFMGGNLLSKYKELYNKWIAMHNMANSIVLDLIMFHIKEMYSTPCSTPCMDEWEMNTMWMQITHPLLCEGSLLLGYGSLSLICDHWLFGWVYICNDWCNWCSFHLSLTQPWL